MEETLTKEERIRNYAYTWYQLRQIHGRPGTPERDWQIAVHAVEAEDRAMVIEADDKFKHRPSRMK